MMLGNYEIIEKVAGHNSKVLYRAIDPMDGSRLLIKVLQEESRFSIESFILKNEFDILSALDTPWCVHVLRIENLDGCPSLIMDDPGSVTLHDYCRLHPLNPTQKLKLAIKIAGAVSNLHGQGIVHKNINPYSILVRVENEVVVLSDFGLAEKIGEFKKSSFVGMGTPEYMSPEQTGRTSRAIDYRSDIYSLGVAFYELFCNRRPFEFQDMSRLLYAHMTQLPASPYSLNMSFSSNLSDVIMKMLEKEPNDRYQSVQGLLSDMEWVLNEIRNHDVQEPFVLGSHDIPMRFVMPVRPYGKTPLLDTLEHLKNRVATGENRMILLKGEPGCGKSYLVNELYRRFMGREGTTLSVEISNRLEIAPYQTIRALTDKFVEMVLNGPSERGTAFVTQVAEFFGSGLSVLTDLFPSVKKLLQEAGEDLQTYPMENRSLIERTIFQFLELMVTFEPPMCLLIDGFELADSESRHLLLRLLQHKFSSPFLMIGTVGIDTEEFIDTELMAFKGGENFNLEWMTVPEYSEEDILNILKDSFGLTSKKASGLSNLIYSKTNGNPYYTMEFINQCCEEEWIYFNGEFGEWDFRIQEIHKFQTTVNVADRALRKLELLEPLELEVLKTAAGMGFEFSLNNLARVLDATSATLSERLSKALEYGLVTGRFSAGDTMGSYHSKRLIFRFSHDSVYDYLLKTTNDALRMQTSYKYGNVLKESGKGTDEELGQLLYHMNISAPLLMDENDRRELARLNLEYAIRLKRMGVLDKALKYAENGLKHLASKEFIETDPLCFKLTLERAQLAYLNRYFDEAEAYFDALIGNCTIPSNRAKAICIKMTLYVNQGKMKETVLLADEALASLGVVFDGTPSDIVVGRELLNYIIGTLGKQVEDLDRLPVSTSPEIILITEIYMTLVSVSYLVDKNLFIYVILRILNITMKQGLTVHSSYAFSIYGLISGSVLKNPQRGVEYGNLGIRLAERFGNQNMLGKCHFTYGFFLNHWLNHPNGNLEHLAKAIDLSDQTGDMVFYSYSVAAYILSLIDTGTPLSEVLKSVDRFFEVVQAMHVEDVFNLLVLLRQVIFALKGNTDVPYSLNAIDFDEAYFEQSLKASSMQSIYAVYLVQKLKLYYMYGQYELADDACTALQGHAKELMGLSVYPEYYQYYSLNLLEIGLKSTKQKRTFFRNKKKLEEWMQHAPQNFGYRYLMVHGMFHYKRGQSAKAVEMLTEALMRARKEGFLQEEALLNELLGRCFENSNQSMVRRMYLKNAYTLYRQWGATAKVASLRAQYGEIIFDEAEDSNRLLSGPGANISANVSGQLDFLSVFKSAQTLSSETRPEILLERLLDIISENAGSEKTIILMKKETLVPVAWSSLEGLTVLEEGRNETCGYSETIVNQAARNQESVIIEDVSKVAILKKDPYVIQNKPVSLMCVPIMWKGSLMGILYMENNRISGAFNRSRLEIMQVLTAQFVISYDNALLYENLRVSEGELRDHKYKLERIVEERTAALSRANFEIQMLLDHAGQGFFSFDASERISSELSRECYRIFMKNIGGKSVSELLGAYCGSDEALLISKIIGRAFQTEECFQAKVYLSLLPQEIKVNDKIIAIEYQMLESADGRRIMVILTDITETHALMLVREEEKRNLKTIVRVIKNRNSFMRSLEDYTMFARSGIHKLTGSGKTTDEVLTELYRMVHTFKGDFAQWGFSNAEAALHEIESLIAYQQTRIDSEEALIEFIEEIDFDKAVDTDLQILENAIGKSFLQRDEYYEISREAIIALENMANENGNDALSAHIREMRLINLKELLAPYDEYVATLAYGLDKKINPLVIIGDDLRIDRKEYHNLIKVMSHILRNIMDHGIEEPEERVRLQKPEYGTIVFAVRQETESSLVIEVEDDGCGIDSKKISDAMIRNNPESRDLFLQMPEDEVLQYVFSDGISTGTDVTTLSGRGIGLSAVRSEVEKLNGRIFVTSSPGKGSRITMVLPLLN